MERRLKKKEQSSGAAAVSAAGLAVAPEPPGGPEKPIAASTVTLRFDERGEPLEAKPETLARAREWLHKSGGDEPEAGLAAELGPSFVDEKLVGHVLRGIAFAQAGLVHAFDNGVDFGKAHEALRLSDKEIAEIAPAAVPVLEKYLPGWAAAHQDVLGLIVVLGAIEANKFEAVRKLMEEGKRKEGVGNERQ